MEAEARMPPLCPSCAPAVFGRDFIYFLSLYV
jgi:hypothetical protein